MASDGRKNGGSHEKSDPISVAIRRTAKRRGNQRVVAEKSMLGEVAAEAARLAEAQTQSSGLDTEVDSMEVEP